MYARDAVCSVAEKKVATVPWDKPGRVQPLLACPTILNWEQIRRDERDERRRRDDGG